MGVTTTSFGKVCYKITCLDKAKFQGLTLWMILYFLLTSHLHQSILPTHHLCMHLPVEVQWVCMKILKFSSPVFYPINNSNNRAFHTGPRIRISDPDPCGLAWGSTQHAVNNHVRSESTLQSARVEVKRSAEIRIESGSRGPCGSSPCYSDWIIEQNQVKTRFGRNVASCKLVSSRFRFIYFQCKPRLSL